MDREEEFEPVHSERVVAVCDVQYCQCKGLTDVCAFCTLQLNEARCGHDIKLCDTRAPSRPTPSPCVKSARHAPSRRPGPSCQAMPTYDTSPFLILASVRPRVQL